MFDSINRFGTNIYVLAVVAVLSIIGTRFIITEFDKALDLIHIKQIKYIFMFFVAFLATKDVCASLVATIIFSILLEILNKVKTHSIPLHKDDNISGNVSVGNSSQICTSCH